MPISGKKYERDVRKFTKEGDALFRRLTAFCRTHGIEGRAEDALSRIVDGYSDLNQRIFEYAMKPGVDSDRFASDLLNAGSRGKIMTRRIR